MMRRIWKSLGFGLFILFASVLIGFWWFSRPTRTNIADRRARSHQIGPRAAQPQWDIAPSARELRGRIVFASNPHGNFDLFYLENGQVHTLVASPQDESYPRWSPDGRFLVFQRKMGTQWDLFLLDTDSNRIMRLTDTPHQEENPAWSPDGRRILYDSDAAPRRQLFELDRTTGERRQLTRGRLSRNILGEYSPDGTMLAVTSNIWWGWSLGLMHRDTSKMTLLIRGNACRPAWSPDGKYLALVYMGWDGKGDIALYALTDGKLHNLTPHRNRTYDYDPRWSPDGRWIVFQTTRDKKHGNWDLMVVEVASGQVRPLLRSPAWEVYPDWTRGPVHPGSR